MSKLHKKHGGRTCKTIIGDHEKYISRITKTLYYGKFPKTDGLSLPVTELAAELFSEAQRGHSLDRLYCDNAAKISRNACVSPCSLVLAILYLERLKKVNFEYLERTAPSDLFLVSLMVSCKFLYDDGETDEVFIDEWALSGGITVKEMAHLEKDFLNAIGWKIYVSELTFWRKLKDMETSLAHRQGEKRGFFTYTELESLLQTIELPNLIQCLTTISIILVASYTAAVFTLLGSVLIVNHIPGSYNYVQPKRTESQSILPLANEKTNCTEYNAIENESLSGKIEENKTEFNPRSEIKAVNILKTGIFLASIEGFLKPYCNSKETIDTVASNPPHNDDNDNNTISWDWWSVPSMQWLSETSSIIENFKITPDFGFDFTFFEYFMNSYITSVKYLELDHINKATKTRIQDQIEKTWHKEWTDTIDRGWYETSSHYYLNNLKS